MIRFKISRFQFLERWASVILVVLAPMVLFWRFVFKGDVLYWGVPMTQFYAWHTLINRSLARGQLPLWTDLLGNGAPLLANHQSAFFYLPNLLFRVVPVEHAMGYSVVLHIFAAGLAAYWWGATLKLNRLGRTVLGLSYALGGYVVGRSQFITIVAAYAWLPLLLALTERLVDRRRPLDGIYLAGAIAFQFLAGHAQTWFYSLLLVGVYALYRTIRLANEEKSIDPLRNGLLWFAAAALLGLGLSAVQLFPTAELALNSQRYSGADWDFAMTYSFWPWRLMTLLAPGLFGNPALGNYTGYANYWEDTAYIGILPLLFAAVALVSWVKGTLRPGSPATAARFARFPSPALAAVPFFGLLLPIAVVLAMGENTPVFPFVFEYLPGFGFFQAPARLMLWFAVGACTLAGIGAHTFRLTYWTQYTLRLTAAGAGAMLVVSLALGSTELPSTGIYVPAVSRLAITLGLAALILLLRGREPGESDLRVATSPISRPVWDCLVAGFVCLDLVWFGIPLTPGISAQVYRASNGVAGALAADNSETRLYVDPDYEYDVSFKDYFLFGDFGPSDVAYWQELRTSGLPNLNAVDGIPGTGNNEPLVVGRLQDILDVLQAADGPTQHRLLRLMNVGHVLTQRGGQYLLPVSGWSNLYQLADPLPCAWLVPSARGFHSAQDVMAALLSENFDPAREVLVELNEGESDLERPSGSVTDSEGSVHSLREGGISRTIGVVAAQPGYLVLAYTAYPGWRATMDGHPLPILRANYAFMALPIEAGEHRVVLTYRPPALLWGGIVSVLSLLVVFGVVLMCRSGAILRSKESQVRSA